MMYDNGNETPNLIRPGQQYVETPNMKLRRVQQQLQLQEAATAAEAARADAAEAALQAVVLSMTLMSGKKAEAEAAAALEATERETAEAGVAAPVQVGVYDSSPDRVRADV